MTEVWLPANKYPHLLVSSLGKVIDIETGKPPPHFVKGGRIQLNLPFEGWNSIVQLHRLIADSFFEDDIDGYEINHIDGDPTNNAIWNLEISTYDQNREHAYGMGLMARPVKIANLDTGEIYSSETEAGRKLGYLSALQVPKHARETGSVFERRGYRLKMV